MASIALKTDERVAIVGRTGAGKTYLAERLVRGLSRLVVIDPKGTLASWGLDDWSTTVRRELRRGEPVRARVVYPLDGDFEPVLAEIYEAGNITVYIDEVYGIVPPGSRPGPYFTALYTRGRELGIGVWAATQRPTWVPLFVLSEADWLFVFKLQLDEDRRRLAEILGGDVLRPITDRHGMWIYNVHWDRPRYVKQLV